MKKSFFLSLIFLLFILYYFLFPLNADKEYIWIPRQAADMDRVNGMSFSYLVNPVLVRTGQYAGILSPEGESIMRRTDAFERDYSQSHSFERTGRDSVVLLNRINKKFSLIHGEGSPLIVNDHYLLADFSRSLIREVNTAGDLLWSWEGVSPLTALSASDRNVAFGTLDGIIHIYRKDGNNTLLESFSNGDDSIIYGLSFSADSSRLAVVAGRNRQTLLLYKEISSLKYELLRSFPLESRYTRPVKVTLARGGSAVWVEQPGQLQRYSDEGMRMDFPFRGRLLSMIPDEENSLVYILTAVEAEKNILSIFSLDGRILMQDELEGRLSHFTQDRGQLSLVTGRNLILLNREVY